MGFHQFQAGQLGVVRSQGPCGSCFASLGVGTVRVYCVVRCVRVAGSWLGVCPMLDPGLSGLGLNADKRWSAYRLRQLPSL